MKNTLTDGFKGEKAIILPRHLQDLMDENEITCQLYLTDIGYYPQAKYHYRERPSGCKEYILIYCAGGQGWIECGQDRCWLTERQFFIIPRGESHAYGAHPADPWSIYWLHFTGENVRMFDSITGKLVTVTEASNSRFADRIQLFNEMYRNLDMGYSRENLEYVSFCLMYFLASLQYIPQFREIRKPKEKDVIQEATVFMRDNLENKITLEDIAAAVGYSVSHLNTLFSQRISYSPMEFYNQLRVQRACSFLQFSELKIKEISFRLGYYDPFHFSKVFQKEMGMSPREFRKKYREIAPPDK